MSLRHQLAPLWWAQFCGACNDNLFKNALIVIVTFEASRWGISQGGLWVNLIALLFIIPFAVFSLMAGRLADRFPKQQVIRTLKIIELFLMAMGSLSLVAHSLWGCLGVVFGLGMHSAFFGPVKYAILPELVEEPQLPMANGWVELGTFLAIILGTNISALLVPMGTQGEIVLAILGVMLALIGVRASQLIQVTSVRDASLKMSINVFQGLRSHLVLANHTKGLWPAMLGNSWFWFFGVVYLTQLPNYCKEVLNGSAYLVTLFWSSLALFVGLGSWVSGRFFNTFLVKWLIPLAGIVMTLLSWDLYHLARTQSDMLTMHALVDVMVMGFFAGIYIVPLYVWIQEKPPLHHRASILGLTNTLNALFMVVASLLLLIGVKFGLNTASLFAYLGSMNALFFVGLQFFAKSLLNGFGSRS